MNITVAGTGYVGLPLAVLLSLDNQVIAYDIDPQKVELINQRKSPFDDATLTEYLETKPLRLSATTDSAAAFSSADFIIIATPTNYDETKNSFNTKSIEDVISKALTFNKNATFIIKSTVPVGYTLEIRKHFNYDKIIFSPEFLRESRALYDNLHPSRIIIGDDSPEAHRFAELLIAPAIDKDIPVLFTGSTEAEAIKLFANTYLAMRVAYFNELDTYCEIKNLNSSDIIKGVCYDPRIGDFYNNPSFGYGGYCLPKDTKQLLVNFADTPQNIISAIISANQTRKNYITDVILSKSPNLIGIYRLTMKSNSDNFRSSSIQDVIKNLKKQNQNILIYEPTLKEDSTFDGCPVTTDIAKFKQSCDLIVANRYSPELKDVVSKVYTRDIFNYD